MRKLEFTLFFVALPVLLALAMPPRALFPVLLAMTGVGLWLLQRTEGFHWRELTQGALRLPQALAFAALVAAASGAALAIWAPGAAFGLIRARPGFYLVIVVLYPILSAFPQEVLFRALWFRRYGAILPGGWPGLLLNGAAFSLAHLMFWNGVVTVMTFAGGVIFAWVYRRQGSFRQAVLLHCIAGWVLFGMGLGIWFYLGNATRPF